MDIPGTISQTTAAQAISSPEGQVQLKTQGGIFTALVESSQPLPRPNQAATNAGQSQTLFEVLLRSNGNQITTQSSTNFIPGQLLKIEVLADASIRVLEILSAPLPQQQNIVQQGLREALPLQQKVEALLNNLLVLRPILLQLPETPALKSATRALDQLLSGIPSPQQLRQPANIQAALQNSGSLFEPKLRALVAQLAASSVTADPKNALPVSTQAAKPTQQPSPQAQSPVVEQLKNDPLASTNLRKLLATDFKAQLLNLTRALAPLLPAQSPASSLPAASTSATAATALIAKIVSAASDLTSLGTRYSLPPDLSNRFSLAPTDVSLNQLVAITGQTNTATSSAPAERFDLAISTVLRQLAATIAKVQSNQLNGWVQTTAPDSPAQQNWQLTLPIFYEQQVRSVEINIERRLQEQSEQNPADQGVQWNVTLGFDWADQGVFYATLRVVEQSVSTTFWSEQPNTLQRIQDELQILDTALKDLGLDVKTLECRRGIPPVTQSRLDQQLVDIRT